MTSQAKINPITATPVVMKWWTVSDICAYFDISRVTLYKRINEGAFPKHNSLGGIRWSDVLIQRYLETRALGKEWSA